MKKVLVITGPTASGKTAVSMQLAKKAGGEIINAEDFRNKFHNIIKLAEEVKK